ncbi:MAG: NTP transferase domain-containing protein [Gemmataceae bacterium]|nr:NTP transferase domain-containing protein [Gemmataceae bacterium]MDW8241639.1 NTP transferase domain-containing protein [Thermogemmata sp.]
MSVVAVVPAAGQSRRMGRPKLLLPWKGSTVVETVVHTVRQGGVDRVLVVIGPESFPLAARAAAAGAAILTLPASTPDMRTTVEYGLHYLRRQGWLHLPTDAWLLVPADHPTLPVAVVQLLVHRWTTEHCDDITSSPKPGPDNPWAGPCGPILVPTWQGRRGHPLLLAANCVRPLLTLPATCGINALLHHPAANVIELPCEKPDILTDLDTPADYARLLASDAAASP